MNFNLFDLDWGPINPYLSGILVGLSGFMLSVILVYLINSGVNQYIIHTISGLILAVIAFINSTNQLKKDGSKN
jgi:F0F1-type ATP synthase assembly protein I